ncbi:hypothetical protein N665_0153s0015 [Sinapis alba]|nr:hypothetical protein N665_0153s0015 [Sinapis alba]
MVNLRFYRFHFCTSFCYVFAEIVYFVDIIAINFPTLLEFALFMFYPDNVFLFSSHGFIERGVLPSRLASSSSWIYVGVLL